MSADEVGRTDGYNDILFQMSFEDALRSARTDEARYHLRTAAQHEVVARELDREGGD